MELFDVYPLYEVTPVRAEDVYVYDAHDKEYLDLYGGHAVISIGHSHPTYVKQLQQQLTKIGFYSNAVQNPLQQELAALMGNICDLEAYQLFLCNSGAEANENALKLASFYTGKKRVIAFKNSFHGRTSAAVAATDNVSIQAPLNKQHEVTFVPFNDEKALVAELEKGDVCAIIFESIQGVGGLNQPSEQFVSTIAKLSAKYHVCLIADEIQSGFGRTGKFFAFQQFKIEPHIISMAKGMGNGFPTGGILVHPSIPPKHGMLGTTFGGNHLACSATLAVLKVLEQEGLMENAQNMEIYFRERAVKIPAIKQVKGKGLMLGLLFDFEVGGLRKQLLEKQIFTGGSSNKKLLRILPPLTIGENHLNHFFNTLETLL